MEKTLQFIAERMEEYENKRRLEILDEAPVFEANGLKIPLVSEVADDVEDGFMYFD